jgi:hypothetical protein
MTPSPGPSIAATETARGRVEAGKRPMGRPIVAQRAPQAAMARALLHGLDPVSFARDRLDFTPDAWQTRLLQSSARRVILNCSRQSGKSTTTAVVACHTAIYRPGSLTLLVSKSLRQSSELFAKVSGFLSRVPEAKLMTNNKLSCELANGSRIISLPGDGDSIRGFSAVTLLIEDEAAFVDDALYMAVRPMLAVSGGRLILMSTPHGKRGHFHDAWHSTDEEWQRERITAYDVLRITRDFLETERATIGEWWFRQEYMCEFVDSVDQLFSTDSIMNAITDDVQPLALRILS